MKKSNNTTARKQLIGALILLLGLVAAHVIIALWPQKITDIQQVMILDGPYSL